MAGGTRFLLGAYALGEARDVGAWYRALSDLEIDGLEHPVRPDDDVAGAARSLARDAPTHWDLVLTTIPTVMSRLGRRAGVRPWPPTRPPRADGLSRTCAARSSSRVTSRIWPAARGCSRWRSTRRPGRSAGREAP